VRFLPPVLLLWLAVDLGIRIPVQLLGWRLVLAARRPLLVVSQQPGQPPYLLRTLEYALGHSQPDMGSWQRERLQPLGREGGCHAQLPAARKGFAPRPRRPPGSIRRQGRAGLSTPFGWLVSAEQVRAVAEDPLESRTRAAAPIALARPIPTGGIPKPGPVTWHTPNDGAFRGTRTPLNSRPSQAIFTKFANS
jgi:hypothetical protein